MGHVAAWVAGVRSRWRGAVEEAGGVADRALFDFGGGYPYRRMLQEQVLGGHRLVGDPVVRVGIPGRQADALPGRLLGREHRPGRQRHALGRQRTPWPRRPDDRLPAGGVPVEESAAGPRRDHPDAEGLGQGSRARGRVDAHSAKADGHERRAPLPVVRPHCRTVALVPRSSTAWPRPWRAPAARDHGPLQRGAGRLLSGHGRAGL